jgi:hypothetical protein
MLIFTSKHIIGFITYITRTSYTIYFVYYCRTSTGIEQEPICRVAAWVRCAGSIQFGSQTAGMAARRRAPRSHRDQGSEPLAPEVGDGAVFNPHMEAFSSHGNGTLSVIKENRPTEFVLKKTVKTKARAKTCTLDDKTDHVIVITREGGRQGGGPQMLDVIFIGR